MARVEQQKQNKKLMKNNENKKNWQAHETKKKVWTEKYPLTDYTACIVMDVTGWPKKIMQLHWLLRSSKYRALFLAQLRSSKFQAHLSTIFS